MQASLKFVTKIPRWTTTQIYFFQQVEMDDDQVEAVQSHQALRDFTYLKCQWTKVGSYFHFEVFLFEVQKKTRRVKTQRQNKNKSCHAKQTGNTGSFTSLFSKIL